MTNGTETHGERPRYYPRQPITAADLTLEQDYLREKLRLHNRLLHGWGIICGATVEPVTDKPWMVQVNPGYLIAPDGYDVHIEEPKTCDIRIECGSSLLTEPDDVCADSVLQKPPPTGNTVVYVVVGFARVKTHPVRVSASGCGCSENPCEYSRWRDSYTLCTLKELPQSHQPPTTPPAPGPNKAPTCPPPPPDPWVVLAKATADKDGKVTDINFDDCHLLPGHG